MSVFGAFSKQQQGALIVSCASFSVNLQGEHWPKLVRFATTTGWHGACIPHDASLMIHPCSGAGNHWGKISRSTQEWQNLLLPINSLQSTGQLSCQMDPQLSQTGLVSSCFDPATIVCCIMLVMLIQHWQW